MIIQIKPSDLEISSEYQHMCLKRGGSFRKGCPNYGKKEGCPPRELISKIFDFNKPIYMICTEIDLEKRVKHIRENHPDWTEAAIYNPRYWQPAARKVHEAEIEKFLETYLGVYVERTPEGAGINIDSLCRKYGVELEWPPRKITRLVSLAGSES
jgi:predicted metal-binding protein